MTLAASFVAVPPASAQVLSAPVSPQPPTPELIERAEAAGRIDLERSSLYRVYALSGDSRLPAAYRSSRPWRGTLTALQLQRDLPRLDPGPERRTVAAALRAPPDPNAASCSAFTAPPPNSIETQHFYIQYTATQGGLSASDYADSLEQAYATEVGAFGWAAPPQNGAARAEIPGKYHVRIEPLGPSLYGLVTTSGKYAGAVGDNPNTGWNDGDAAASCMVLNSDFETGFAGTARQALDATTAHEYNHSIQFGYGALDNTAREPEDNFIESAATWMEDEVQDASNDNYDYLYPEFDRSMGEHPSNGRDEYAYWLTWRGITERFGSNIAGGAEQVMQSFWERLSRNESVMLDALNAALVARKGRTLPETFHDYAIAARLMRSCGGVYFLPYCLEEAAGYISSPRGNPASDGAATTSAPYSGSIEDNYTINWVDLPASGAYDLSLTTTGGQLRATMACDTGAGVAIAPFSSTATNGTPATIAGFDASSCSGAPVAVITNELQTAANPDMSAVRSYSLSATSASPRTSAAVPSRPVERAPDNSQDPFSVSATPSGSSNPRVLSDSTRPAIGTIRFSNRRFRAARRGPAVRAAAGVGTRVRYSLSESATTSIRYERKTTGRRVGGRCRATTRGNRGRARCTRWVLLRGTVRRRGRAGTNRLRLMGRMNNRTLRPGAYRLRLSARDAANNVSRTRRSATFRIVRR